MLSLLLLPTWEPGAAGGRQSAGGGRVRKRVCKRVRKRVRKRVAHVSPPWPSILALQTFLLPLLPKKTKISNLKKEKTNCYNFLSSFLQDMLSRSTIALAIAGSAAAFAPIMSMDMGRREV